MGLFSGTGLTPSLKGVASNVVCLQAGQVQLIQPAGWYGIRTGSYTTLQQYDPIMGIWQVIGGGMDNAGIEYFYSDGVNYRLANQTGCAVGALITNAGTGFTTAPVVTPTAGGSKWRAIIGGAISTTIVVTNGGSGYTYPPKVVIAAPPPGGIQATAYCTLTSNAVSSVTVVDQGAGYAQAPQVFFQNDPREGLNGTTIGQNAAAITSLTGSGTMTGLVCLDHGNPVTSIPTLSFAPTGSTAAATVIMCWTITGAASYVAGNTTAPVAQVTGVDQFPSTAAAYRNPTTQSMLVNTRNANIWLPTTGTALAAAFTSAVILDGGIYTSVPLSVINTSPATTPTAATLTYTVGGAPGGDVSYVTQY